MEHQWVEKRIEFGQLLRKEAKWTTRQYAEQLGIRLPIQNRPFLRFIQKIPRSVYWNSAEPISWYYGGYFAREFTFSGIFIAHLLSSHYNEKQTTLPQKAPSVGLGGLGLAIKNLCH